MLGIFCTETIVKRVFKENYMLFIDYSPFIIVTVTYEIGTNDIVPQSFITGYEEFEEAVIDMDLIEADEDLFSDIGWDLTVLEMYHVGDTVVWKNKLPMTPVA